MSDSLRRKISILEAAKICDDGQEPSCSLSCQDYDEEI